MGGARSTPRRARSWAIWGAALGLAAAAPALADEPTRGDAKADAPAVGLDRLLKLPTGADYGVERRGGLTRGEWHERFARIDQALARERQDLEKAQGELDRVAGSADQWLLGPPGTTNPDAPLDYRLRQEITRHKDEITRLEKNRKDLVVEANLAGVPDDWR